MTTALQWLLGLERIRLVEGGPLSLRFATPPAPWIMLAGAVLAVLFIGLTYRKERVRTNWRWLLMLLRIGAMMTVLFLIGQPMLVLRRNHVDPSRVVVLLDRSLSMMAHDVGDGPERRGNGVARLTRWEAAVDDLTRPEHGLLPALLPRQRVNIWTYAQDAAPEVEAASKDDLASAASHLQGMSPDGTRSDLTAAINKTLEQTQGSPLAAIIVVGDGRQTISGSPDEVIAHANARSLAIHVLAAGSGRPMRDLAMESAYCEKEVFMRDRAIVQARASAAGFDQPVDAVFELRDKASGELLATKTQRLDVGAAADVELAFRPRQSGRRILTLTVNPRDDEENVENNSAELEIHAHDEKIQVLYVEGSPRFEYRYLKNMLIREPSIESSCLLVSATPGFAQEGSRPIRRFPQSIEELRSYDVIILGDVDPRGDWISPVQQTMLCDLVMQQGTGAAFLAGELNMPHRLRQTPLEKLLPVRIDPAFRGRYEQTMAESFSPRLTVEGRKSPLLRLDEEDQEGDSASAASAHPEWFAGWYWYSQVLGPQPAATVLLAHPLAEAAGQPVPLAVMGRAGAGRTFYLGSDDLWRSRQAVGEAAYEAFWLRVIRTLARGRVLGADCAWRFTTDRQHYEVGEPVRVKLSAHDKATTDPWREVTVGVSEVSHGSVDRVTLKSAGPDSRELEGTFTPRMTGHFLLVPSLGDVSADCKKMEASFQVTATDRERMNLQADHEFLRVLASRTGGQVLSSASDFARAAAAIPDRGTAIADDVEEPLWDKGVMVALFSVLVISEWIVRKGLGLT